MVVAWEEEEEDIIRSTNNQLAAIIHKEAVATIQAEQICLVVGPEVTEDGEVMVVSIHIMATVMIKIIKDIVILASAIIEALMRMVLFRHVRVACNNKRNSNKIVVEKL